MQTEIVCTGFVMIDEVVVNKCYLSIPILDFIVSTKFIRIECRDAFEFKFSLMSFELYYILFLRRPQIHIIIDQSINDIKHCFNRTNYMRND